VKRETEEIGARTDGVSQLILKRGSASRSSGQWRDGDYGVLEDGVVVGRISKEPAAPQGRQWGWTSGHSAAHSQARGARLRADARGGDGGVRKELEEIAPCHYRPSSELPARTLVSTRFARR